MKFGLLKSKIEKNLLESYSKGKLAEEIKIFKKLVLENKTLSRLYYLYDELNSNKGFLLTTIVLVVDLVVMNL